VLNIAREDGFTIAEMLVSTTVMLLIIGAALQTFSNALQVNDAASQMADSNQNLRAGTNQLIKDVMMAGRVIGAEGIALPNGAGSQPFNRPGPVAGLTFGTVSAEENTATCLPASCTLNLPSITTGYQLGPMIDNQPTDMITIMTIDEFTPNIATPPAIAGAPTVTEGTIAADGKSVTLPLTSVWLVGDAANDTKPLQVGDLVYFKSPTGNAIQTITSTTATSILFASGVSADWFNFNQPGALNWPMAGIKGGGATSAAMGGGTFTTPVTMMRAMMITYYVDSTTTPGAPRLTRQLNHFTAQALAGVVEDLDLTYDLVDGTVNPAGVKSLPFTIVGTPNQTYNAGQIRKVNLHVGVRSETMSKPSQDYVRNHISTAVDVRNLASKDRYKTAGEVQ
jgi:type II secretory pathway pseudopilin PulG